MRHLFIITFLVLPWLNSAQTENYDVRSVRWGMTKDEVIKAEGAAPSEITANSVHYVNVDMGKLLVRVAYTFVNNQLSRVDVILPAGSQTSSRNFDETEAVLKQKYGNASELTAIWATENKKLKSDSSAAVSAGALARNSNRTNARTSVYHTLYGRNGTTIHQLIYRPRVDVKVKSDNSLKF